MTRNIAAALAVAGAMLVAGAAQGAGKNDQSVPADSTQLDSPLGTVVGPLQEKPIKHKVTEDTVGCRRTTDFEGLADAVRQLDVQWLSENGSCLLFKKGSVAYLIEDGFPLAKYCFGPEANCVPLWAPSWTLEAAYVAPASLARGALRICRDDPTDVAEPGPPPEYPGDIRLPAGLTFVDNGTIDDMMAPPLKLTVITTKRTIIKHGTNCAVVPAEVVNDESGPRDQAVERALAAAQHRVLTAVTVSGEVPDNFPELFGTVATDFR
jgi:hypothetical protein